MFFSGMPSVKAKIDSESSSVLKRARLKGEGSGIPSSILRQPQKKGEDLVTSSEAKISLHFPSRRPLVGSGVGFRASIALTSCSAPCRSASLPHWPRHVDAAAASSRSLTSRRAAAVPAAAAAAWTSVARASGAAALVARDAICLEELEARELRSCKPEFTKDLSPSEASRIKAAASQTAHHRRVITFDVDTAIGRLHEEPTVGWST
mmetsp:Transcript_23184/g.54699  ORF Transcript_23184/g.54699 Transcript_23184/m.54699 type:complete len:207 (-) Transcript_23184:12-632(-)